MGLELCGQFFHGRLLREINPPWTNFPWEKFSMEKFSTEDTFHWGEMISGRKIQGGGNCRHDLKAIRY